jgi:hypothetical protein
VRDEETTRAQPQTQPLRQPIPAHCGEVTGDGAGVVQSSGDLAERAGRRVQDQMTIVARAPARQRTWRHTNTTSAKRRYATAKTQHTVASETAAVTASHRNTGECAIGSRKSNQTSGRILAPAKDTASQIQTARVVLA